MDPKDTTVVIMGPRLHENYNYLYTDVYVFNQVRHHIHTT